MIHATERILVLRALGLGDLCAAVPALRALRRHRPDCELVLAAPAWQEPLAQLAGVDRVVDTDPLSPIDEVEHGAHLAVNLHGRGPQSTRVLADTEPERFIAFAHPHLDRSADASVTWRPHEHEVHRWCRLLAESGIPADPTDLLLPRPPAPPEDPSGTNRRRIVADGAVVVHPGAAAPARRWPAERFGAVVAALVERGHSVVLTGTAEERPLCEEVLAVAGPGAAGSAHVLAGETDLMGLAHTVAGASLMIANDTGVAHLATAFAIPSVVLFGPTPPTEWGPPPTARHRSLWAGRRGDPHGTEIDPGLDAIEVEAVIDAIEEVSGRVPA